LLAVVAPRRYAARVAARFCSDGRRSTVANVLFFVRNWVLRRIPQPLRTFHRPDLWKTSAQEGELRFHKQNRWRETDDFRAHSKKLFEYFGFREDQYAGKTVIDLGAGSRLRTKFFRGARLV